MNEEILLLTPYFSHTIWGGTRLRDEFGYDVDGDDVGECWGISAHPSGESTVRAGRYAGKPLSEVWSESPELFGGNTDRKFPLLVKIIDAQESLSVQVHPDDAYAGEHENGSLGKSECWYILDCPEDATIIIGHNAKSREELREMIEGGRWDEFIREIPIKKGDFIPIEPGTVHAIQAGTLILETQQSSDITYRVYDYGRLQNGKPRELHIEKSIDVIQVPAKSAEESVLHEDELKPNTCRELYSCQYYQTGLAYVDGEKTLTKKKPYELLSVLEGEGTVNGVSVKKGDHMVVTSRADEIRLAGKMRVIVSAEG